MTRAPWNLPLFAAILGLIVLPFTPARGQDRAAEPLRLQGVVPGGVRTSMTESWGTFLFTVVNQGPDGRNARLLVLFPDRPDVQFGRDIWVPAGSIMSSWVPVGPAPAQAATNRREVQTLLYDRTGGRDVLVLPPTEERVRSRLVPYRGKELTTAVLLNDIGSGMPGELSVLTQADSPAAEALMMTRVLRQAGGMPEFVSVVAGGSLPPTPAAFDGIDHFVLASNRLAADPPGREALRHWVQQGGRLWVMLDQVAPDEVAGVLGDDVDFQVVDRVGLTTVRLHRRQDDPKLAPAREFEKPVDLVRVVPTAADRVIHNVNGWPASFTRQVGRGKVLFTTLGARGWYRPRTDQEPRSPYPNFPDLPVALTALGELAAELRPRDTPHPFSADSLRPLLAEEIGYSVIDRRTVAAILGAFVLALLGLGVGLRRSRRPELLGWLAPAAAVAAAGVFLVLGIGSRQAVPPTVAVAEVVDAVPGSGEAAVNGLFATYNPTSGPATVGSSQGAALDLDTEGLEGQVRRRVQTDSDAWHWENLSLPAGIRSGPFRRTARTGRLAEVARFGPGGVEGRLESGKFRNLADGLITTPAREPIAVRFGPDGSFAAGAADALPPGQFMAGSVLTDRQQRRQAVYRQLLTGQLPEHLEGRDFLLAWAEPADIPFTVSEGARAVGTALLIIPLQFEHTPPGTPVTVPQAFVPYRRVTDGRPSQPTLDSTLATDMRLRFQVPASVLPMTVERATLVARVRAPGWRFSVSGLADGTPVPLHSEESPVEPIRLEIADARLLRLDDQGGLHLNVALSSAGAATDLGDRTHWKIESLAVEIVGRTTAEK